jgi:hypothetical protein
MVGDVPDRDDEIPSLVFGPLSDNCHPTCVTIVTVSGVSSSAIILLHSICGG